MCALVEHMGTVRYPESGGAYRRARRAARVNGEPVTQKRLAEAVGIKRRFVIRVENGENRPRPALRDRIANALSVDPRTLPAAGEDPFVPSVVKTIPSSAGFVTKFGAWFRRRLAA